MIEFVAAVAENATSFLGTPKGTKPALVAASTSAYPISFGGDPYTFGFALFSMTTICSICLMILGRQYRFITLYGIEFNKPIGLARLVLMSFLTCIFCGAFGDVLFLYAYGAVKPATLGVILAIDRFLDAFCIVPFLTGTFLMTRGEPAIMFQLLKQPLPIDVWPTWHDVRRNLFILGLIMCLSAGVTVGK